MKFKPLTSMQEIAMNDMDSKRRHRKRPEDSIILAELRRRYDYDAARGCFVWKVPLYNIRKKPGDDVSGQGSQAYAGVCVLGHRFKVHRLIWLWHTSTYPVGDIDHINGNTRDNRIENLRIATSAQNAANRIRKNTYGVGVGIAMDGKFVARITIPGTTKRLYLGRYDSSKEAAAAYIGAAAVLHGEFSVANRGEVGPPSIPASR